jgi:hypothetical protein
MLRGNEAMSISAAHLPNGFVNRDLATLFVEQFVTNDEFGKHGFEYNRKKYKTADGKRQFVGIVTEWCSGDPWWWPKVNGQAPEEWGLASDDPGIDEDALSRLLISLRGGVSNYEPGTRRAEAWEDFPGSVGASLGCCIILSTRPSVGEFPSANTKKLHDVLAAVWPGGEFLQHAHVTDLSKFRGPTQDSNFEGMTNEMWQKSIRCLRREFDLLKPKATLIMPGTERYLSSSLSTLISTVKSARARNTSESAEITSDVAFLRLLWARRRHCMDQVPYWAPSRPKSGDEQEEIAKVWCTTLTKLGVVCT